MIDVWSCGGGVQSVAIAALIVQGKLPQPDYSVIVDTGYERSSTWEYFDFLRTQLPIDRVAAADFATVGLWGGKNRSTLLIPAFSTLGNNGASKLAGFCSNEWKMRVKDRWLRAQGVRKPRTWLGISTDEKHRANDHSARFPLIELGMSRTDCLCVIDRMGWPAPPRSSCWMCPNHGRDEWLEIQRSPDWPLVVEFEREMQKRDPHAWLTRDCAPIDTVDFTDPNLDLFGDAGCDSGVCFV